MSCKRWTVLCWGGTETDKVMGLRPNHIDLISEHFNIIWKVELEENPSLGLKVDAAIVTPSRPIEMIYRRPKLFSNLKVVGTMSLGVDHVDMDSLRSRGIRLSIAEAFVEPVAELALSLLLALTRGLYTASTSWGLRLIRSPGIQRSTVGIVGLGRIGSQTARLLRPHGCRILYYSPRRRSIEKEQDLGVTHNGNLHEMLMECDSVVMTCPLTNDTDGMFGEAEFKAMKPSACFINVARGKIVDTEALTLALQEGWIGSAGLDVTEPQDLPENHPLKSMDNVLITPHIAVATKQAIDATFRSTVDNIFACLEGREMSMEYKL